MHYTSIENIHRVIDPLFMDEIREEFKEIEALKNLKIKKRRFLELRDKMASLKFLDPAAGSRVIIMITADSNDGDWLSSPLLEKQNMDWCAF